MKKTICKIKSFEPFTLEFQNASTPFLEISIVYPEAIINVPLIKTMPELGSLQGMSEVGGFTMTFEQPASAGQLTDLLMIQKDDLEKLADLHQNMYQDVISDSLSLL